MKQLFIAQCGTLLLNVVCTWNTQFEIYCYSIKPASTQKQ